MNNSYPEEILVIFNKIGKNYKINQDQILELVGLCPNYKISLENKNSLIIEKLTIAGKKQGENFKKEFKFFSGVNVICTDGNNLRGKTSIMQIIRFILTGDSKKLTPFVLDTVKEFEMDALINGLNYKFEYKNGEFKLFLNKEIIKECKISDTKKFLSEFFEEKFNYYSLKEINVKNNTEKGYIEKNFNWKSYFSTLYLETQKYSFLLTENYMDGIRNKIIGVLFNLEYHQILNDLEVKHKKIVSEFEKVIMLENKVKKIPKNKKELEKEMINNKSELKKIMEAIDTEFDYEKQELYIIKQKQTELENEYFLIKENIQRITFDEKKYKKRLKHKEEAQNLLKYIPVDICCPNCYNPIDDKNKKKSVEKNICYICGKEHKYEEYEDIKDYTKSIKSELDLLDRSRQENIRLEKLIKKELEKLKKDYEQVKIEREHVSNQLEKLINKRNDLLLTIREIESEIGYFEEKEKYQSKEVLNNKLNILKDIIYELKQEIYKKNKIKMNKFKDEFLSEAKQIGTRGLEGIEFSETNYIPKFKLDGKLLEFENISAGQQLRIKISFYLTWLKLTLSEKGYNHPAFLMIDSPGREETNDDDLEQLSNIFFKLNETHKNFQIIIASAKNLYNATEEEKLKIYKDTVF